MSNLDKKSRQKFISHIGQSHTNMNLVGQYERAIIVLVNDIIKKKYNADLIANPILYLMRHSIELALKENIKYLKKYSKLPLQKIKTHSLTELFTEFENHYFKIANDLNFLNELMDEYSSYSEILSSLLLSLGQDDSSFRYIYSATGSKIFNDSDRIDILTLKEKFDSSIIFLTHTADVISPYTDFADYIKTNNSILDKSFGFVKCCFPAEQKEWIIQNLNKKYKSHKENKIWIDKLENCELHLKVANKKCYVIPMKY